MSFQRVCYLLFCIGICSCQTPTVVLTSSDFKEIVFIQPKPGPKRQKILETSLEYYVGNPICSQQKDCRQICDSLFSDATVQTDCYSLNSQQIFQIQKLYQVLLKKTRIHLEDINIFDLKVFFNLSSEPLFDFFQSLDSYSIKLYLNWIAVNWQVANVFQQEDKDLVYLDLFLNKLSYFPIKALKEEVEDNRTFIELSWLKQNDSALIWLNSYLKDKQCGSFTANNLNNCLLAQYCLISESFQEDVLQEFTQFNKVNQLLNNSTQNFKSFCLEFCSSNDTKGYCATT